MIRQSVVALAGVAIAGLLYLFGRDLWLLTHYPINVILFELFFFPAYAAVPSIPLGDPSRLYLAAAGVWPVVSVLASIIWIVFRLRAWWGKGLGWAAAIIGVGAWAAVKGGEKPYLVYAALWSSWWAGVAMLFERIVAKRKRER